MQDGGRRPHARGGGWAEGHPIPGGPGRYDQGSAERNPADGGHSPPAPIDDEDGPEDRDHKAEVVEVRQQSRPGGQAEQPATPRRAANQEQDAGDQKKEAGGRLQAVDAQGDRHGIPPVGDHPHQGRGPVSESSKEEPIENEGR